MLIETARAIEEIDAILAVPGLDLVIAAPFDLSSALGVRGDFDAPVLVEAIARLERAAAAARVPLCGVALTPEASATLSAKGYRALINGFDVLMLEERTAAFATW